jgi:hypothetical protein
MHLQEKDLELYILGELPPRQASTIETHLLECTNCGTRLSETVRFVRKLSRLGRVQQQALEGAERRRGGRVPTDDPAFMQVLNPLATNRVEVRVLDVSRDGLKLRVPEFLPPGSVIQVRMENSIALGEVRYCRALQAGFDAGVQLQDVFESPEKR